MSNYRLFLTAIAWLLGSASLALEAGEQTARPHRFEVAHVRFEQNATDGDVEVVFEVLGGDEGLAKLTVVAPDGRTVIDFTAPDASTLGIRSFHFESPEPPDVDRVKAAYPEGVYTFTAATPDGKQLHGEAALNHKLPETASFRRPAPEAVPADNLRITWREVKNVAAYIIEIEQDELGVNLTAKLPGTVNSLAVPDGFLRPGTEYQLAIGTVAENGNISFVETSFTTARKP